MLRVSLGTRLVLLIVGFSLIAVLAVTLTAYQAINRDFEALLTEQQSYEATRVSTKVSQSLQMRLKLLEAFGTMLNDGNNLLPAAQIEALLGRQSGLREFFSNGLLVMDERGIAIAEDTFIPDRIGTSYADHAHFRKAMETRQAVISRPIIGRTTGVPLLSFATPIQSDDGDLLGFVSGNINLSITSLIPPEARALSARQGAEFMVIDTDNFLYVESPDSGDDIQPLPNPGENALIDAAMSGQGLGLVESAEGDPLIYATSHLEGLGWLFIRAVPQAFANAPATESFYQFAQISLLVILVMLPLGYLVTRSAMAPLERMTRRIGSMSADDGTATRLDAVGPPEVQNLARAFNQLQDDRDAVSRMQDDFISNVSHELRTPLTSLNGALKLINSGTTGPIPEKAAQMSRLAQRNGERLQLLISELLDFSKIRAGKMTVNLKAHAVKPIIVQAIQASQAMAQLHGVKLADDCEEDILVHTDAHRLRQILDNFINNAIKFSPAQGRVTVTAATPHNGVVRLTVSDQGDGIPEHFKPRLFQRFAQAETGSTRASQGTGLGLAICKELTSLLGGTIGAFNDQGAHFWVELPLAQADFSISRTT